MTIITKHPSLKSAGSATLLQDWLERAAKRTSDQEAVVCRSDSLSYGALDELCNKLAGMLRSQGVGDGDRVGVYLDKSIDSIVAIFAILKAAAVYVPLDSKSPPARVAYIIADCGIRHLIVSSKTARAIGETFAEGSPLELAIVMDGEAPPEQAIAAATLLRADVDASSHSTVIESRRAETELAYILYTSGSTGRPKGVMISHRNAVNFVEWVVEAFALRASDRLSNHAPLHFDLSILDVFGATQVGATLVLVPDGTSTFPIRLADWIEENRITVWYSVPSVLTLLVTRGKLERHAFKSLRAILFAGEVFPVKYLNALMQAIPNARYYNLYGPTETNVITFCEAKERQDETVALPIGVACANADVYAERDDGGRVEAPGESGELIARGACVAQGYWNDSEKTAQAFSELAGEENEHAYRTGDFVSLDEAGNWIYLGRRDQMIKSRGYRIELGEIEAALYAHPDVSEAGAFAVPDELLGNRIAAVVVLEAGAKAEPAQLRAFCVSRLPTYMVPENIILKDRLPRTSTGKLDRAELVRWI